MLFQPCGPGVWASAVCTCCALWEFGQGRAAVVLWWPVNSCMLVISGTIPLDVRAKMRPSKSCSGQMIEAESTLTCSLPVVQMIPHNSLPSGAVSARGADVISLFSLEMLGYEPLQAAEPARFGGEILSLIYLLTTITKSTFSGFFPWVKSWLFFKFWNKAHT